MKDMRRLAAAGAFADLRIAIGYSATTFAESGMSMVVTSPAGTAVTSVA